MLQTEYIRNLNCNYERILLDQTPEENRYQYCIISRGGIRGLLPCSLRYINNSSYLYYDISSTQNVAQLYTGRNINRAWMKDFLWSMKHMQRELRRFLLDDRNILFYPTQVYQDLEKNDFLFQYIPYYEKDLGFRQLIEFWVEHINYEDECLVEFVYKAHEQYELLEALYLQEQIFEDVKILDKEEPEIRKEENTAYNIKDPDIRVTEGEAFQEQKSQAEETIAEVKSTKKGLLNILDGRRKKQKSARSQYQQEMQERINGYGAVCEETIYQESEEYGKTVYITETPEEKEVIHRLYQMNGKVLTELNKTPFIIGKKKEEADCVISDHTISRVHAKILIEERGIFIEDLNSTNGTFKNGLRMQPYEKRKLEIDDEIKLGKVILIYR